ncbi:DUF3923 family protein [Macrococcus brunensis]|uniref:DUF3923 family protein n=1 Tax=Macrococcus brunensis TaxID=198483 RepID=UPI001EF1371A|nr:DUF3923 family protein [Macrococcus brunensis]ULG74458.1 DUF3923 family protein [Macrococcus brunensis]
MNKSTSWILWSIYSAVIWILFLVPAVFVWVRTVDGSGATQTFETRMVSLIVLISFFMIPFIIQLIWMICNIVFYKRGHKQRVE